MYNYVLPLMENFVGKESTYLSELTKAGKIIFGDKYIGTFPSDKIPHMNEKESCIVNLDNSKQGGSHWVAVVQDNNQKLIYDSFGRKTKDILPKINPSIDTEYDAEQGVLESNCGARSLSALCVYYYWGRKCYLQI